MKKIILFAFLTLSLAFVACEKDEDIPKGFPRSEVPAELQGRWMYGKFSMTEYWSQNPSSYLGNALTFAIAFKFNKNGTYEQYFTSSSVMAGVTTYHQSVTTGTMVIDPVAKTIRTHGHKSHYRRTRGGVVEEERDLNSFEIDVDYYTYTSGVEPSDAKAMYITLKGTASPLTFVQQR